MDKGSVSWDYWKWQHSFRPPVITRRKVIVKTIKVKEHDQKKDRLAVAEKDYMKTLTEIVALLEHRVETVHREVESVSDNVALPIMAMIDEQNGKIEALAKIVKSISLAEKEKIIVKEEPTVIIKEEKMPDVIKDAHIAVLNLLMSRNSAVSYGEIASVMSIAKSSARVYISELQKLEFPVIKQAYDGKIFVSILPESFEAARQLAAKYGFALLY